MPTPVAAMESETPASSSQDAVRRSVSRNLISVYGSNAIIGVIGTLAISFAVRTLDKAAYGLYSVYGVLASLMLLAEFGTNKNLFRLLAADRRAEAQARRIQSVLGLYLVIAGALVVSLPVLLYAIPRWLFPVDAVHAGALRWIIAIATLEYIAAIPISLVQTACMANERFDLYSKFNFVSGVCRYVLMCGSLALYGHPVAAVAAIAGRRVVEWVVAPWIMGNLPRNAWRPRLCARELKDMLLPSSMLWATQVLQTMVIAVGSLLVNAYFGMAALGTYRAAFDLASRIWFFSNGIGLVVFPRLAHMLGCERDRKRLFSSLAWLLCASWFAYNLMSAAASAALPLFWSRLGLKGPELMMLLLLLVAGIAANGHANLSYEFLQAAGRYRAAFVAAAVSLLSMATFFLCLRAPCRIFAIGWAWIASQCLYAASIDGLLMRLAGLRWRIQFSTLLVKLAGIAATLLQIAMVFVAPVSAALRAAALAVLFGMVVCAIQFLTRARARLHGEYA